MLHVTPSQLQIIHTQAIQDYPHECCGLLLGSPAGTGARVAEVWPTANAWNATVAVELAAGIEALPRSGGPGENFSIAPQDLLQAQKAARDRHLAIIGIYHSHPDHPAQPSEFDRAIAWPAYYYLILSVCQGRPGALGCWRLNEQQQFQAESLVIQPHA